MMVEMGMDGQDLHLSHVVYGGKGKVFFRTVQAVCDFSAPGAGSFLQFEIDAGAGFLERCEQAAGRYVQGMGGIAPHVVERVEVGGENQVVFFLRVAVEADGDLPDPVDRAGQIFDGGLELLHHGTLLRSFGQAE